MKKFLVAFLLILLDVLLAVDCESRKVYLSVYDKKTQRQAINYCNDIGMRLVEDLMPHLMTEMDRSYYNELGQHLKENETYWLGRVRWSCLVYNNNSYIQTPCREEHAFICEEEIEECNYITSSSTIISDETERFVYSPASGKIYLRDLYEKRNFTMAAEFCQRKGMHLVDVVSQDDLREKVKILNLNAIAEVKGAHFWTNVDVFDRESFFWRENALLHEMLESLRTVGETVCVMVSRRWNGFLLVEVCAASGHFMCEAAIREFNFTDRYLNSMCFI